MAEGGKERDRPKLKEMKKEVGRRRKKKMFAAKLKLEERKEPKPRLEKKSKEFGCPNQE